MATLKEFMVVHWIPGIYFNVAQANWENIADVKTAKWVRTYKNKEKGIYFCLWKATDEEEISKILLEIELIYETIVLVKQSSFDRLDKEWEDPIEVDKMANIVI